MSMTTARSITIERVRNGYVISTVMDGSVIATDRTAVLSRVTAWTSEIEGMIREEKRRREKAAKPKTRKVP